MNSPQVQSVVLRGDMRFLEIPIREHCELGDELLNHFKKNNSNELSKEELIKLVRTHQVYFQNKPVGFLPFKVFKKGKAQLFLNLPGWEITKKEILFEDKWIIVVNKPSGIPSQSSLKFLQDNAYGAVLSHLRDKKPFSSPQLFLMHRLDMDTSGVLMMSKKSSINKGLQDLFEKKQIHKTYLAVSKSETRFSSEHEVIKSYLGRKPDSIHKFKFGSYPKEHPNVKFAETHIKLLKEKGDLKFFEVLPQTGRSHQIRVHMAENNLPIIGDTFYNGSKAKRLHLHARSLEFTHPQTKDNIKIEAPIPTDWQFFK